MPPSWRHSLTLAAQRSRACALPAFSPPPPSVWRRSTLPAACLLRPDAGARGTTQWIRRVSFSTSSTRNVAQEAVPVLAQQPAGEPSSSGGVTSSADTADSTLALDAVPARAQSSGTNDADTVSNDSGGTSTSSSIPGARASGDKLVMLYTCTVCEVRSARTITKAAYMHGVVLVRCPGCNNLHLVADHLGYFDDNSVDVEALLEQRGEQVRRGSISAGADGHVCELTEADVAVLRSPGKSVELATGKHVHAKKKDG